MIRIALAALALSLAVPADACPMADAAAFAEAAAEVESAEGTKVSFTVDGMSCGSCSTKVVEALNKLDGVFAAAVDYQSGKAVIAYDDKKTNADSLLKAIADTGFEAKPKQG